MSAQSGDSPMVHAARRRAACAWLSLLTLVVAPLGWWHWVDIPWQRSSGAVAWALLAIALGLALAAATRDRRRWVRGVAIFQVLALAAFAWFFFVFARLPSVGAPERAIEFTLPDQDGRAVALSAELARGPVLLVFFRGHW